MKNNLTRYLASLSYPLGGMSQGVYAAFSNALLPLFLIPLTANTWLIGALVTASAFESAVVPIIIGPLSDRTPTALGRRKLYLLIGTAGTVIFLLLIPMVNSLTTLSVLILAAGLSRAVTVAPHMAMLTSNSSYPTRSRVSAYIAVCSLLGQVIILLLAYGFWQKFDLGAFSLIACLFAIPTIITIIFSRDNPPDRLTFEAQISLKEYLSHGGRNLYLLSQVFLWFGINSVLPFFTLFLKIYLNLSQRESILLFFTIVAISGLCAYPLALLGKRIGDTNAFRLGLVALIAAAILGIFAHFLPLPALFILAMLAGVGIGATTVFSFSILTKYSNEQTMGLTSGVSAMITAGSAPIAAIISGKLIEVVGYPVMFLILALTTGLSYLFMKPNHAD